MFYFRLDQKSVMYNFSSKEVFPDRQILQLVFSGTQEPNFKFAFGFSNLVLTCFRKYSLHQLIIFRSLTS